MSSNKLLKVSQACAVKLKRNIISISGKDATSVLQGITTNNITQFASDSLQQSIYCGFLNSQGRLVSDAIIVKPKKQMTHLHSDRSLDNEWQTAPNEYWIDTPLDTAQEVYAHIKHYLFRKKVNLDNLGDQLNTWAMYTLGQQGNLSEGQSIPLQAEESPEDDGLYKSLCFSDPRSRFLGARCISNSPIEFSDEVIEVSLEDYRFFRLAHSILEGKEVQGKLPFLVNMDLLNGINFNKGCYVGQELTARSYHTGIVRKRCFSFLVGENLERDPNFNRVLEGEMIMNNQEEAIGKVVASQNNLCVSTINYIDFELKNLKIGNTPLKIIQSQYIQEKLNEYKEMIKKRM